MTNITSHAKNALELLVEKHNALKAAKLLIEEELKIEAENRLAAFKRERDIALRLADEAGVPRTRIGKALGTTNYKTVQDILEATRDMVISGDEVSTGKNWSATRINENQINIEVSDFGPTSINGWVIVSVDKDGDLVFESGDEFVIPAVYRAGIVSEIVNGG